MIILYSTNNSNSFSYSCGYRKAFEEYATIINGRYPDIVINGANYDPPGINYLLNKVIFAAKMLLIIVLVSSYDIWNVFGRPVPRWWTWCTENKIYACMMIFFLGNVFEAQVNIGGIFVIKVITSIQRHILRAKSVDFHLKWPIPFQKVQFPFKKVNFSSKRLSG